MYRNVRRERPGGGRGVVDRVRDRVSVKRFLDSMTNSHLIF